MSLVNMSKAECVRNRDQGFIAWMSDNSIDALFDGVGFLSTDEVHTLIAQSSVRGMNIKFNNNSVRLDNGVKGKTLKTFDTSIQFIERFPRRDI